MKSSHISRGAGPLFPGVVSRGGSCAGYKSGVSNLEAGFSSRQMHREERHAVTQQFENPWFIAKRHEWREVVKKFCKDHRKARKRRG